MNTKKRTTKETASAIASSLIQSKISTIAFRIPDFSAVLVLLVSRFRLLLLTICFPPAMREERLFVSFLEISALQHHPRARISALDLDVRPQRA
jgi:hypothetical protein